MDKIENLIKSLTELKEELEKASKDPKLAPKETKVKNLQAQIDAGAYKPNASKIADKMLNPSHDVDSELHPSVIKPENLKRLIKEELTCSENGQWNIVEKAVKQPNLDELQFSGADHIKPKKYQDGDPRHANDVMGSTHYRGSGPQTKSGKLRPEVDWRASDKKLKGATSGTSKK